MKTLAALIISTSIANAQIASCVSGLTTMTTPTTTTVGALPTCNASTNGMIYRVSNALIPTVLGIVAGGGSVTVLVHCDGVNWLVG